MKAFFGGLYFIDWFCIWETGSWSFCLGSDSPIPPNATFRVSLNVMKAAHGPTHLFKLLGQPGFYCRGPWPLVGFASIQLHH